MPVRAPTDPSPATRSIDNGKLAYGIDAAKLFGNMTSNVNVGAAVGIPLPSIAANSITAAQLTSPLAIPSLTVGPSGGTYDFTTGNAFVSGNLYIQGNTVVVSTTNANSAQIYIDNMGTGPALTVDQHGPQPIVQFLDDGVQVLFVADGGNVAIGNITPAYTLDVAGTVHAASAVLSGSATFSGTVNVASVLGQTATFSGNVSVGNLYSVGDVVAQSDLRLKTDLQVIDRAAERVQQLRGYTFTKDGRRGTGVVAQEVQRVLPEAVHEDADGTLSVAYGNMAGLLIEALRDLTARVERLEGEIGNRR